MKIPTKTDDAVQTPAKPESLALTRLKRKVGKRNKRYTSMEKQARMKAAGATK